MPNEPEEPMTDTSNVMSTQDTLLAYSEWLDSQHIVIADESGDDNRTHDDLAKQFIEEWESDSKRATLAGRYGAQIGNALKRFVDGLAKALEETDANPHRS
jgi:hypothetical protein